MLLLPKTFSFKQPSPSSVFRSLSFISPTDALQLPRREAFFMASLSNDSTASPDVQEKIKLEDRKELEAQKKDAADILRKQLGDPPEKPLPGDCCGSGCVRCVWDIYFEELEIYNRKKAELEANSKSSS